MFDLVELKLKAGNGGSGHISFRREKFVPKGGPDGGDGGDGGNIFFCASSKVNTLRALQGMSVVSAQDGKNGSKRKKTGAKGADQVIEVPVGTRIMVRGANAVVDRRLRQDGDKLDRQEAKFAFCFQRGFDDSQPDFIKNDLSFESWKDDLAIITLEKSFVFCDFDKPGEKILVCQGGFGGKGNARFKASNLTTPRLAELGSRGEAMEVALELRLIAKIGLVGLPNVGKSTLLFAITSAKPKIGNYPFTTTKPNLGLSHDLGVLIADVPGLIEGACEGKGLGNDFLRHVSHCLVICLVVAVDEAFLSELAQGEFQNGLTNLQKQIAILKHELESFSPELGLRHKLTIVTKTDLYPKDFTKQALDLLTKKNCPAVALSSATNEGLKCLNVKLEKLV